MEHQLRLNQCVGQTAQELQKILNTLESDNQKIHHLRQLLLAAQAQPELLPPLKASLHVFVMRQDLARVRWKTRQAQWLLFQGCDRRGDRATPLPSLIWIRPPADILGEQALEWSDVTQRRLQIQLLHSPRGIAAQVYSEEIDEGEIEEAGVGGVNGLFKAPIWKVQWSAPQRSDQRPEWTAHP